MVDEVVALVEAIPAGTFLDATIGGAGHASAVLAANPSLDVLGVDQDPLALEAAADRLRPFPGRYRLVRRRFDQLDEFDGDQALSGFLFDLGVSSPQLDVDGRGFSFRRDGPLDMRMDPDAVLTAEHVVNTYSADQLADVLRRFSDERHARRIAERIVSLRPFGSTAALAQAVVEAIPAAARRTGGHPAKRTFQAIRIEVNAELSILRPALQRALDALMTGGRGLVLSYHSGEDRIVKDVFRSYTTSDVPPGLPVTTADPDYAIIRPAARRPTETELTANPRSASARLRAIERRAA